MTTFYPWQQDQWSHLLQRHHANGLPHALLFTGPAGIGKLDFARILSQSLLCNQQDKNGQPCGVCKSCQLLASGTHPDLDEVLPEEEGKAIKIDQIRALIEYLTLHSHYRGPRVVILSPADKLNIAAANSLLKTLEEPRPGTLLMLITSQPTKLPATIRSRCQLVRFNPPETEAALNWLRPQLPTPAAAEQLLHMANGGPLLALEMATNGAIDEQQQFMQDLNDIAMGERDPLTTAAAWLKATQANHLHWLYIWVCDMIKVRSGAAADSIATGNGAALQSLAKTIDLKRLYAFLDKLGEAIRFQGTSANDRLTLEGLLILWANLNPQR